MSVAVQKYIKNMAKSVTYATSDVLSSKFEYVKDFKNENQEVFKEVYSSVKDYRNTFSRVKKTITNNKVMDAARVGYDSIMYSITTGDFYAKNKETEVIEKYGGNLMADMDIDDDDFDWDNEDLSTGDKVIATAIKKNSKVGTALTVEAVAKTGKAQMDASKENTMLLYTQNERLLNKLDGGFANVLGFLRQNGEQTAKIQNQMNENLNKFMTNVDNNVAKLTKQMDELLEMQRNMYNPVKQDEKKKVGYSDIIGSNGVINIKEYLKQVKKQGFNQLNDASGGALSMLFGNSIEGSNLLATFASSPFRNLMTTGINKALGSKFDKAAAELNTTLQGMIPSLIAKLNAAGKKEDNGIMGFLGKIFGIKDGSKESIKTDAYTKGAIPFDGITKRAITDVIPYYLRKMTSVLTGEQEMVYDFNSGRWTNMKAVKTSHDRVVNSANKGTADALVRILEGGMGGRRLNNAFENKRDYEEMMKTIESFAAKLQASGDYGSVSDLSPRERELKKMLDRVMRLEGDNGGDRRFRKVGNKTISSGRGRSKISEIDGIIRQQKLSQNTSIKNINEGNSVLRLIDAEGLAGIDQKKYHGKSYVNSHGDFSQRSIQQMPVAQALIRAKDEYGVTLYQYLRDMGMSLRFIKANSIHLENLTFSNKNKKSKAAKKAKQVTRDILNSDGELKINYRSTIDKKYVGDYYAELERENERKENERWEQNKSNALKRARDKNKPYALATTTDYRGENDEVSLMRLISDAESDVDTKAVTEYNKQQKEAEDKKWKRLSSIIGSDRAKKLRESSDKFEQDKSLNENMKKVKDEGTSAKLMMFTKFIGNKVGKPGDVMADTILKVDFWLQKILYGNDLKEGDDKKGFFQHMKETVEKGFDKLKEAVSEAFGKLRDKITGSKAFKAVKKFFVGEKDEEGIYQGGVFGSFMGGMQRGLRKNAKDVKDYAKQQALAAKNKITNSLQNNQQEETNSTTTSNSQPSREEIRAKSLNQKMSEEQASSLKERILNRRGGQPAAPQQEKYNRMMNQVSQYEYYIEYLESEKKELEQEKEELIPIIESYTQYKKDPPNELLERRNEIDQRMTEIDKLIDKTKQKKRSAEHSLMTNSKKLKNMAVGGVNKTGKPFDSVLSAGEYLNGNIVPKTGIYTVPKNGVVVNPADASTRAKQASNEKKYLSNIRKNAEANDKLSPSNDSNQVVNLMTNKDWRDLKDDKQRAEFLGSVASKGLIGGGLGLLVGGPLLGAAVGAASSLTKSTDAFSSLIFGSAVTKDGKTQVDEDGNIVREDDGLISKEIMKAVPDIKKFGLGGAIAGLITPLGPLGGILAGSALGFAKNSEIFQGSLFGEGGVLSDENISKLKKGAKNMGIGAIIGAFTGPFGLVGNALLGATAGYVTSTDKFKDAIFGEKIDPNDPNSKRQGGVVGTIKSSLVPLKDFGLNLRDKVMDEIFGKKGDNDKREGGIFGAIRENVVQPMISGTKSVFDSLKNKFSDMAHLLGDMYTKYKMGTAGNGFFARAMGVATNATSGLVHGAGTVLKTATKPFRLLGDDGLGGKLKAGRIKKGQEYGMTARERLMFRGQHKMLADDKFSESDKYMADASASDLNYLKALLSYRDSKGDVDKAKIKSYSYLGDQLRQDLSPKESKKVLDMVRSGDFGGAERFIRSRKISDEAKSNAIKNIGLQKTKLSSYDDAYKEIENNGGDIQELLDKKGIKIDAKDPKALRYFQKQLDRELAHKESGLTNEEIEFDKQRKFWNETLEPISSPLNLMTDLLEKIYNEDKLNNEYNKLTAEYNKLMDEGKEDEAEKVLNQSLEVKSKLDKVRSITGPTKKDSESTDAVKKLTESTKQQSKLNKVEQVSEMNEVPETVKKVIEDGLKIFDIKVMKFLADKNAIESDIEKWRSETSEKDRTGKRTIILTRSIGFVKYNKTYEFEVKYKLNLVSFEVDINGVKQPDSFNAAREDFSNEYVKSMLPKEESGIWAKIPSMTIGDMIKKTMKISGFFIGASIVPGGVKNLRKVLSGEIGKIKKKITHPLSSVKFKLGSHELDVDLESKFQKKRDKKYSAEAEKELQKILASGDLTKLNDIANEKYDDDYNNLTEDQKSVVNKEFLNRYVGQKRSKQILGHGLVGDVKALAGTIKSGVKNKVAGGIDKVKEKKLKHQEQEDFLGKLFTTLDKWKMKDEKKKFEGKKDSKLAKIIKWLFIGGIATPIIVGFVKDKIMPAIHEKIQPWLEKAKDKIIGKKNQQTGEYEGGIVSGIVNPIRNFFKDKFQTIHDWFHNEGKFTSPETGFRGLINNFIGAFKYGVKLWQSGASTIINDVLPGMVKTVVSKLPIILKAVAKGVVSGIAAWFGKTDEKGKQSLDKIDASSMIQSNDKSSSNNGGGNTGGFKFNNTVGGTFTIDSPPQVSANPNYNFGITDTSSSTTINKNANGTTTMKNDETGKSVTSELINDNEMVSAGKNESGTEIFYKRSDKNRTQPYSKGDSGQYVRMDKQAGVVLDSLNGNTSYEEMLKRNEKMDAGVTDSYTGETPFLDNTVKSTKILTKAMTSKKNAKGLTLAIKGGSKLLKATGKVTRGFTKMIPLPGVSIGGVIADKGMSTLGNIVNNSAEGVSNRVYNLGQGMVNKALEKNKFLQKVNDVGNGIIGKKNKIVGSLKETKAGQLSSKLVDGTKNIKSKAKDIVSGKTAKSTDTVKSVKSLFAKAKDTIVDWFKKLFKNGSVKKAIKEAGQDASEEAIEKIAKESGEKLVKECTEAGAEKIAKAAGKNVIATACDSTGIGVVINIAMAVADFLVGMDECRNILQIVDKKVPITWRVFAGIANALQDIPGVGIIFGIIGAKTIVWFLIDVIGELLFPNATKKLKEKQKEAKETLQEYNRENNTNLTLEQYNNKYNATLVSRTKGLASDLGSFLSGKDATVSQSMESRRQIEDSNKKVTKIRKKLEDIASHMWEKQGRKFKKLKLTKETYGKLCAEVIDKIVILLNSLDDNKLDAVLDSAGDMRLNFAENTGKTILKVATGGLIDVDPFNDAWDDGYRGLSYLGLDENKFENNSTTKCVGGIASVFVKSCGGAGLKPKIIDIVISVFCNGMGGDKIDDNSKAMVDQSNAEISDINETYSNKGSEAQTSNSTTDTSSTADQVIATNANANNKLSPLKKVASTADKLKSKGSDLLSILPDTINKALSSITGGGFEGIGEIINSLRRKNTEINRRIDELKLLPTDKEYWNIEVDNKHPFASALFKFTESIARVIKAPFSLSASMNATTAQMVSSGNSSISANTGSSQSSNNNSKNGDNSSGNTSNSSGGIFSKIKKTASKLWGKVKSIFGKGKGDSDESDPYHIYQRDFNQSFNISGDSEHQSVADSGCGPASAASILRMYGKEGNMNSAVKYALNNNYKEQDGGTYPSYFQDYLGKNGISTNSNATDADVINNLANNKPVILMGQNKSGTKSNPYGNKYSHYVVAKGFDKNGNVIIEDSEDKRGNTRYSLADTLRNTSVRITTGRGKFGRGSDDMSVNERYITNVNNTISATVSSIVASAISAANIGGSTSSSNNNTGSTGTVSSSTSFNIDSDDTIICGDSITWGLGQGTKMGKRAMGVVSGTTDKNCKGSDGQTYETQFKANSDVISKAKNVIFFWGMNEVFTGQSTDEYFAQYQDSIDTILGYGGKKASDMNVCIMTVIWVPDGSGYGGMYTAKAVEEFNEKYIKPFAQSKGYPLIDIYEDSKDIPHGSGDVHPGDYEKLYEIIKKHTGGSSSSSSDSDDDTSDSGSGRGKSIIERAKRKSKYGRSIWGRDGEETDTSSTDSSTDSETSTDGTTDEETDSETSTTDTSSSTSSSSEATGLISLLGKYSKALTKGIFGDFYDALYGSEVEEGDGSNSSGYVGTGDAAKMLGKSLTLSRNNGKGDLTMTIAITEDEVELYDMLTRECGLNAAVACGVLANWEEECGINSIKKTATRGVISYGGGIMQWTPGSVHTSWAEENGFGDDPWSWEANKAHAKAAITSGNGNWGNCTDADPPLSSKGFKECGSFEEFKQLTSAEDAAVNYERAFEVSFNWNGRTSENATLPANKYYDNNRALGGKILYELIVNGKCDSGGSGRGKEDEEPFFYPREETSTAVILKKRRKSKYGKGIWGRDGQEDSTSSTDISTTSDQTSDTQDQENTDENATNDKNSNTSSSSSSVGAKSLITKLGKYAKAGIKGVYGNFYDALYGSEVEEGSVDGNNNGGYTDGSGVIYAAAMVFEAMGRANPTFGYCYCGGRVFDLECRDGKKLESVRPDCSGMMSAVAQYMGYYTYPSTKSSYTDTFHGLGYNVTKFWAERICDKDGNVSPDWEYMDFNPNDRQPGDMIIRNDVGHIDMYVFTDTNGRVRGFNAGSGGEFPDGHCDSPGSGIEDSYNFAKYYLEHGNQLPANDGSMGATTIQDSEALYVVRYKGNGGSGRGKGQDKKASSNTSLEKYKKANSNDHIKKMPWSVQQNIDKLAMQGRNPNQAGRGILKSFDEVKSNVSNRSLFGNNQTTKSSTTTSSSNYNSSSTSSSNAFSNTNNNSIDLNQLISLINIIANNSDKIDAVVQLLATIATNTENTSTAITKGNNKSPTAKNNLSALRSALDSNNSGMDIVKAVYQIAQS